MTFFKLAGVFLVLASGGALAARQVRRERRRVEQLAGFVALVRYVKLQIDCFSLPVPQILLRCDRSILSACGITGEITDFEGALRAADLAVPPSAERLLFEFGAALGGSYRAEQLRLCEHYLGRLQPMLDTLRAEAGKRERMAWLLPMALSVSLLLLFW